MLGPKKSILPMETLERLVKNLLILGFGVLVLCILYKFFLGMDAKPADDKYLLKIDSLNTKVKLLFQKDSMRAKEIQENDSKIKAADSLRSLNDKNLTYELKKLKASSRGRVISFADSVYLSEQGR